MSIPFISQEIASAAGKRHMAVTLSVVLSKSLVIDR
jgi:hypothetical protein